MLKSKYKMFFDFAKEERWLSEMSQSGYALVSINWLGRYTFQQTEPRKFNYRVDYRVFQNAADFQEYRSLFEDSGWKHICGAKSTGAQYFVQMREDATDDIFSDAASRAGRYKRLSAMWLSLFTAFIPVAVVLGTTNPYGITAFTNPKALYFTPGLWQMTGTRFWRAFLFETPFAAGRGFLWLIVLAVLVFYLVAFLKARLLYRRYLEEL